MVDAKRGCISCNTTSLGAILGVWRLIQPANTNEIQETITLIPTSLRFTLQAGGLLQQIDPRLINEISRLTNNEGVVNVVEMKRHLSNFVKTNMFANSPIPPRTNKRYFPTRSTIKNHIYAAIMKQQLSTIDQRTSKKKIQTWQEESPEDNFKFRPYVEPEKVVHKEESEEDMDNDNDEVILTLGEEALLFVHQTKWQRRLLLRYGNELTLLDATYKTTKYALPLFFLVVKTNVDYQVVASFVTQSETTEAVKEALQVMKEWTPDWSPKSFMVDNADQEINAIEQLFPGIFIVAI